MAAWKFRILVLATFSSVTVIVLLLVNDHGRPALGSSETASPFYSHERFRPAVTKVQRSLVEVPLAQSKLKGEPPDFFKPRTEVVNPMVADYIVTPRVCGQSQPFLLVLQMSLLHDSSTRAAIRETWGSVAGHNSWPQRKMNSGVKVVFVVGHKVGSEDNVRRWVQNLTIESASYEDILYLDMDDTYRNLTVKVLSSFYWANVSCPGIKFMAKVDADTFVNAPLLVDALMLAEARLEFSIVGFVYSRGTSAVMRGGRWAVNESQFPMTLYPEYASGCAYVLSQKAVSSILGSAPYVQMIPVEDVFVTGIMRYVISCQLFSLPVFFTHHIDRHWDRCDLKRDLKIMATGCNIERLKEVWATYLDKGLCS